MLKQPDLHWCSPSLGSSVMGEAATAVSPKIITIHLLFNGRRIFFVVTVSITVDLVRMLIYDDIY